MLVRPREGDVVDTRPVVLVVSTGPRADQQVQLLVPGQPLGHLGDDPGPEPVRAGRVVRVVGERLIATRVGQNTLRRDGRRGHPQLTDRTPPAGPCTPGERPRPLRWLRVDSMWIDTLASVRAGQPSNPVIAMVCISWALPPLDRPHDVRQQPRGRDRDQHVAGAGQRLELVLEARRRSRCRSRWGWVADVVLRLAPGSTGGAQPQTLHVVALEVVGDRRGPAVAAGEGGRRRGRGRR